MEEAGFVVMDLWSGRMNDIIGANMEDARMLEAKQILRRPGLESEEIALFVDMVLNFW